MNISNKSFLAFIMTLMINSHSFSQKLLFAQDYHFQNKITSSKLMGSEIMEDSITHERLVVLSGGKSITFYLINESWKLVKTFDAPLDKKSAFSNDMFTVNGFSHKADKWTIIVGHHGDFTAEVVDAKAGTHSILGKVFEDKDTDYRGTEFTDENKNYSLYFTKNKNIAISYIDENAAIHTSNLDLASQLPLKKSKKYSTKELFENIEYIKPGLNQVLYFTSKKVHFYARPDAFVIAIKASDPAVELNFYDKTTFKKTSTELFSVEDLLPASAKNDDLNTGMLMNEDKVWVYSGNKNAGVLAAFDIKTKKVLFSKQFDEKMDVAGFNYGPVMYRSSPGASKGVFSGQVGIKETVEDITAGIYLKELFKRDAGIVVQKLNEQEYVVSIGTYNVPTFLNAKEASVESWQLKYPWVYEDAVAGFVFTKNNFALFSKKTNYNEVNARETGAEKPVAKKPKPSGYAEYEEKKAFVTGRTLIADHYYIMYYYEDQFKIAEKFL